MQYVNYAKQQIEPFFAMIDKQFQHVTPLRKLADLVNLRLAYFVILFFLIAIIGEGTGILSNVFVSIFGFLYPGYMTFRALSRDNSDECKEWLVYWIVFGFFTVFAGFLKITVFFFLSRRAYNILRIIFYIYLFHPATHGSAQIYHNFLKKGIETVTAELQHQVDTHTKPKPPKISPKLA